MTNKDWFMDYAEHAVRAINIETRWLELRGWITKNGRHVLIGDDSGAGGKSGENLDKTEKSGIIESEGKRAIIDAFKNGTTSEEIVGTIVDNHKALSEFTPKSMKESLEELGYKVKPLGGKSSLKNIPFEKGGGYRTAFLKDGYFQYHPAVKSHHRGAYWKASCGKKGDNRYDMDGNPIK